VQLGVVHLDAGRRRDVGRGHLARALLAQVHHDRLVVLGGDHQFLQVQDDVGDIFLDAGDVENSCSTPSILMLVTAAPGIEDSSVRRSELPIV
jgi:hypothetical protein